MPLHVRSHQGAVRVVVLQERHQRRRHTDDLLRRHVHVFDAIRRHGDEITSRAGRDGFRHEPAVGIDLRVGLGDEVFVSFDRRQEFDLIRHPTLFDSAVRRFDEAELVDPRIGCQRRDQTDVRTFRRLDGANAAVVRRMHVAHFESGPFPGQPAGTESRQTPFVRDLRQRVGLIHELRQLAAAEEFLYRRHDRLRVDQVVRQHGLHVEEIHALLDAPLHAHEAEPELILQQFADRPHPAVAQVIDVVDLAFADFQIHEIPDHFDDVLGGQSPLLQGQIQAQFLVQLQAADRRQVVPFRIQEQIVEQRSGSLHGRSLTRTQAAIDLDHRLFLRSGPLHFQRVEDHRRGRRGIEVDHLELFDFRFKNALDDLGGQTLVLFGNLVLLAVHQFGQDRAADQLVGGQRNLLHAGRLQLGDQALRKLGPFADERLLPALFNHLGGAAQTLMDLRVELTEQLALHHTDFFHRVVHLEQVVARVAERLQENGRGHFPAAVDADIQDVAGIELEIEPRTAIRNNAGAVQHLAAGVCAALVVRERGAG